MLIERSFLENMLHNWLQTNPFAASTKLFVIIFKEHGQIFNNNILEISETVNLIEFTFKV